MLTLFGSNGSHSIHYGRPTQQHSNTATKQVNIMSNTYIEIADTFSGWINIDTATDWSKVIDEIAKQLELHPDYLVSLQQSASWTRIESKIAFIECFGEWSAEGFEKAYQGEYSSDIALAEDIFDSCGYADEIPKHLLSYFDMKAFARDLMDDYTSHNGHYFYRDW